jgi:hypothetical protein
MLNQPRCCEIIERQTQLGAKAHLHLKTNQMLPRALSALKDAADTRFAWSRLHAAVKHTMSPRFRP